jgi:uncharacterized protein (DUF488 family)
VVYTVGHGSRTLEEFLTLLRHYGIRCLADIRAYPGSRRHPHFAREALAAEGIRWAGSGRIPARWRHGAHGAQLAGLSRLLCPHGEQALPAGGRACAGVSARHAPAVMCAERLYWHCRRFFLSDYLLLRGARVVHLISEVEMRGHHMNPLARVEGDGLIYDAADISRL